MCRVIPCFIVSWTLFCLGCQLGRGGWAGRCAGLGRGQGSGAAFRPFQASVPKPRSPNSFRQELAAALLNSWAPPSWKLPFGWGRGVPIRLPLPPCLWLWTFDFQEAPFMKNHHFRLNEHVLEGDPTSCCTQRRGTPCKKGWEPLLSRNKGSLTLGSVLVCVCALVCMYSGLRGCS